MSKESRRPDNRRALECATDGLLAFCFCPEKCTGRIGVCVQVRQVNEARDAERLCHRGELTGRGHVHIVVFEVLCLVVAPDQVVDNVGVAHALFDLVVVAGVPLHGHDLTQVTHRLEMPLGVLVAVRDHHLRAPLCESVDHIATEEACAAKHGSDVAGDGIPRDRWAVG